MKTSILNTFLYSELIGLTDFHFATFISALSGESDPDVLIAVALVSQATGNKHVCLDLKLIAGKAPDIEKKSGVQFRYPEADSWREKLLNCTAVGRPGSEKPLILDDQNRLYLYRYWQYEQILARSILERVRAECLDVETGKFLESLKRLYPDSENGGTEKEKTAAIVACLRHFCVITGGPGTGKTTAVAKILALLLEQAAGRDLRILLSAPTGKSAIRMGESIQEIKRHLNCTQAVKDAISIRPRTIHRMLKPVKDSPDFFYGPRNLLPADVVVVDEASMVDLPLMAKLIQALPKNARLILIGDKDQLASVEAGSVLGDICGSRSSGQYSEEWRMVLKDIHEGILDKARLKGHRFSNIGDCIVRFDHSYRFSEGKIIEKLGRSINRGDARQVVSMLKDTLYDNIEVKFLDSHISLMKSIETEIITGYTEYLAADDPLDALGKYNRFKILCTVKKGSFGVEGINRAAEFFLSHKGLIDPSEEFYAGRPILITENDYQNGLYNGDIGLIWPASEVSGFSVFAYFQNESGDVKRIHPRRLPEHETAFAMTVHKSQGSEFENILFLLPERDTPILSCELLYTGITRAKKKVMVWGGEELLNRGISRTIIRDSGLLELLWM